MFERRSFGRIAVLGLLAAGLAGFSAGFLAGDGALSAASADQAVNSQPLPALGNSGNSTKGAQPMGGVQPAGIPPTGAELEGGKAGNLHICNADEITTLPELQSDAAYDCINAQNYDETPKALMCGTGGKAFCCTQKVDQLGQCKPIIGGKKRSTPVHEPIVPKGEPGSMENMPMDNMPAQQ